MMSRLPRILVGTLLGYLAATAAGAGEVDFGGLLTEMLDRSRIAEFPEPAFACKQASSYNRKSRQPGTVGWFATDDYSHFRGLEQVDGRREWVMLDVDGPGVIVRWWITQYKYDGTIRVYLDGSDKPVLEGKGDELVGGRRTSLVGPPLSAMRAAGCNLYLPIPFKKHCKITYDGRNAKETRKFADNIYYNINYLQYPKGTEVKTFALADLKANAELLARVQRELLEPEKNRLDVDRTVKGGKQVLGPGQSMTREVAGGGAICMLKVKVSGDDMMQATRSTVIKAHFDGKQRVWAPIGEFFGSGLGLNPFKGWWRQVEKDGWMTCWWPMPFKNTAAITISNHGTTDVTVELGDIRIAKWPWTDRTMYFNSTWRGDDHIAVFGNDYTKGEEWNYVTVKGRGVYAGDTMAVFNRPKKGPKGPWWGEGDEKIYVDGESFPSHFGTGTEDYFGYAWGTKASFEAPFHAQPIGGANKGVGHTTNTRTRMLDRIPFESTLKVNMELMHWQSNTTIDYATTTYWYALDGAESNGHALPEKVRKKVGQIALEHTEK